jgi:hypothetical protein
MTKARILADYVAGGTTAAEFDYMDGVTSNVQTQLTAKAPLASPTFTGNFTSVGIDDNADALAITIDSSENVGIGTATPAHRLQIKSAGAGTTPLQILNSQDGDAIFQVYESSAGDGYNGMLYLNDGAGNNDVKISTNGDSWFNGGNVGIGTAAPESHSSLTCVRNAASSYALTAKQEYNHEFAALINHSNSNPYGMKIVFDTSINDTTHRFFNCTATGNKLIIYSNGSVQNVDGTYGSSLSDERLKINIKDANSQWEDVKNINIVNYKRLVDGEDSRFLLSVIAQQVKEVSPGLIGERPPDSEEIKANPTFGTLYKEGDDIPEGKEIGDIKEIKEKVLFFKDSIFFWKCTKALQEAMGKIETLEAKVTTLENA